MIKDDQTEKSKSPQLPKSDWQQPELIDLGSADEVSNIPGIGADVSMSFS
jgi:hypothetical protein